MIISGKKVVYIDFEIDISEESLEKMGHSDYLDYDTAAEWHKFIQDLGASYDEVGEKWFEFEVDGVEGAEEEL